MVSVVVSTKTMNTSKKPIANNTQTCSSSTIDMKTRGIPPSVNDFDLEPGDSISSETPVPPTMENQKLLTSGDTIDTATINSLIVRPREIRLIKTISIGA